MVVIAVIAVIATIAIPAYIGYLSESRLATARMNADSLRIFMEDFQIDNATYVADNTNVTGCTAAGGSYNETQLEECFGWSADGDQGAYAYLVTATTLSWDITVSHNFATEWIRCDNRMSNCCDSETTGASTAPSSCP